MGNTEAACDLGGVEIFGKIFFEAIKFINVTSLRIENLSFFRRILFGLKQTFIRNRLQQMMKKKLYKVPVFLKSQSILHFDRKYRKITGVTEKIFCPDILRPSIKGRFTHRLNSWFEKCSPKRPLIIKSVTFSAQDFFGSSSS